MSTMFFCNNLTIFISSLKNQSYRLTSNEMYAGPRKTISARSLTLTKIISTDIWSFIANTVAVRIVVDTVIRGPFKHFNHEGISAYILPLPVIDLLGHQQRVKDPNIV